MEMKLLLALFLAWLPIVALAAIISLPYEADAQNVKASWDVNVETNVAGYRVVSGPQPRAYVATNIVVGRLNNTATVNLPAGVSYLAVQAFGFDGAESPYSVEVAWTNALKAPTGFRLVATLQASASSTNGPWRNLARLGVEGVDTNQVFRSILTVEASP
jgi:hypothetical protein